MAMTIFPARSLPTIPVQGRDTVYPLHRIFCVGRNYAAHAAEMGAVVDREAPFYFTKSPFAFERSGSEVSYPPGTADLHHEVELAVMLSGSLFKADPADVPGAIFGFACALDMTRRDLQEAAKADRRPWDLGKDFDGSAIVGDIRTGVDLSTLGDETITLTVNGETRQAARLSEMIHDVPAILSHLSGYYRLAPGDVVLTGTPAGVGAVRPGDDLRGQISGIGAVALRIGPAADPA
ncbi:MAG: fumarylacetoacetate hydrolase family protein [Pseudomonadota bacterium]